jgi:AhpD family alkylhydroperoxidase
MIAAHVSARNECAYCRDSHAAIASAHCGDEALVAQVTQEGERAPVSPCARHRQPPGAVLRQQA